MRVGRRSFLATMIGCAAAAPAVLRAQADAPQVTLKLHHFFSSVSGPHDRFLAPWARKVEADSGGRILLCIELPSTGGLTETPGFPALLLLTRDHDS